MDSHRYPDEGFNLRMLITVYGNNVGCTTSLFVVATGCVERSVSEIKPFGTWLRGTQHYRINADSMHNLRNRYLSVYHAGERYMYI